MVTRSNRVDTVIGSLKVDSILPLLNTQRLIMEMGNLWPVSRPKFLIRNNKQSESLVA